jgi:hypothetical protein
MRGFKAFLFKGILGCAVFLMAVGSASAETITFNSLTNGTVIANQFSGVTFSTEAGQTLVATSGFFCTASGGLNCTNDVYIDFANAVSNISIEAIQPNEFGTVATFLLYNGATLLGSQNLTGLSPVSGAFGSGNVLVDLGAFNNVTRLEIRGPGGVGPLDNSYGGNGIGWDNLSFEPATTVPEPNSLLLLAIGGLALLWRRPR